MSSSLKGMPQRIPCLAKVMSPMEILGPGPRRTVDPGEIVFVYEYITEPPHLDGETHCLTSKGVGLLGACFLEEIVT